MLIQQTFPPLSSVFPQDKLPAAIAMGHTEDRRAAIVTQCSLDQLRVEDQLVKALLHLAITNPTDANIARQHIDGALAMFCIRGVPHGEGPSPRQIRNALNRLSKSLLQIEADLSLLMLARQDTANNETERGEALEQIQHAVLGSIAANVLPQELSGRFSFEDIAAAMPTIKSGARSIGWENGWNGGFAKAGAPSRRNHAGSSSNPVAVGRSLSRMLNILRSLK